MAEKFVMPSLHKPACYFLRASVRITAKAGVADAGYCKILGIVIKMYFQQSEHNPPHIHAVYGEYIGAINIETTEMLEGDLPAKALRLVQEWVALNRSALLEMWKTQEFHQLPPLE